jgi:hypothetical protein
MHRSVSNVVVGLYQSGRKQILPNRYTEIFLIRSFSEALNAIVAVGPEVIKLPDASIVPSEIANNPKMMPFFKDCIGALDGTHIECKPPAKKAKPYRNRKGDLTQNVLAVCSFDLRFLYVLPGWEGSAADGSVLLDAISAKGLAIPEGKYYLGDAGYPLKPYCLTPYRGVRYRLREWAQGNQRPRNPKELYNLRHAQQRNAIERIFGVLKKRFPILNTALEYPMESQVRSNGKRLNYLCTLHVIIDQAMLRFMRSSQSDSLFRK